MRINFIIIVLVYTIVFMMPKGAVAQFIRIYIEVPPGFELNDRTDFVKVLEPPKGGKLSYGNAYQNIRWLELRAFENIQISLRINWAQSYGGQASNKSFVLNDGSTDFNSATELQNGWNSFELHNGGRVISDMPNKPTQISAWIGIPANKKGSISILYP